MTTKHLVDPELAAILDILPATTYTAETLPLIRTSSKEMFAQMAKQLPPVPNLSVSEYFIPGPAGGPEVHDGSHSPRVSDRLQRSGYDPETCTV